MAGYGVDTDNECNFTPKELFVFRKEFGLLDIDGDGSVTSSELGQVLKKIGEDYNEKDVDTLIASVDKNKDGKIQFNEFLSMVHALRSGNVSGFGNVYKKTMNKIIVQQSHQGSQHSFTEEEKVAFVDHINMELGSNPHLQHLLPIDSSGMDVFSAVGDGVVLANLINVAVPGTIDDRVLNLKAKKSIFEINENLNLVVASAKAIGCSVVNVGADDIKSGLPHIVLGLLWQIIRIGLFQEINLTQHPELVRLLHDGESLEDFLKLPPEQILIRWVNYHLAAAGSQKRISNFSGDIKDSEAYTTLLHQIAPNECDNRALNVGDHLERAEIVLQNAEQINCRKFVKATDIVKGQPKLNLAFVANIFNTRPALDPPEKEQLDLLGEIEDTDDEGSREQRAFRNWMISMGIDINDFFQDLRDGVKLLECVDKVTDPSIVSWKRVNRNPRNKFKKVENCNYVVLLGKQLNFSLVNIGGPDFVDGNKKLLLGFVWQLMRAHILQMLKSVNKGGKEMTENDILAWANAKVKAAGKSSQISSFSDPALKTGKFLIDLSAAIEPRSVNYEVVSSGANEEEQQGNAKYAIGCARKLGATIFLLWEDIVEVKKKMILTFIASLMHVDQTRASS